MRKQFIDGIDSLYIFVLKKYMLFCSFIFDDVSNLILLGFITKLEQFFDIILSLNLFVAVVERRRLHDKLISHALDD